MSVLWLLAACCVAGVSESVLMHVFRLNYTPVAVGIIFVFSLGSWVLWARKWFTGPVGHMVEEEGVLGEEAREQAREVLEETELRHEGKEHGVAKAL